MDEKLLIEFADRLDIGQRSAFADLLVELAERLDNSDETQGFGHDAQLGNIELQNVLQKQQQTLQMMSSISKLCHDTATSIVRKID